MRQLEKTDNSSKSLLANVLDLEDDFLICSRASFSNENKINRPSQIPSLLPHSSTFPHVNSDVNLSSTSAGMSPYAENSPNFPNHQGILKNLALINNICVPHYYVYIQIH